MDYDLTRFKKNSIKRAESTKSHLWWWDSHIGLKNSKWLENNLDEMDRSVKRMVKLIEEDADSFAKKAEMYYQKRPELLTLVDEFHRMYRSLAERYENITGELRKTSPVELQSQGSGFSDVSSSDITTELNRLSRPPSSRRAPGFDYFLGSAGGGLPSSDVYQKDGDDSASVTDSELESDESSVTSYPGYVSVGSDFQYLTKRVADLDLELREAKERVRMQLEGNTESLMMTRVKSEFVDYPAKLAAFEQELRDANEKIQSSEDQIYMLKSQLARYLPSELDDEHGDEEVAAAASTQDMDIESLSEELRITTLRLREAEKENGNMRKEVERSRCDDAKLKSLQSLLDSAQKEIAAWKSKSTADRREVAKLQDRVSMLKSSLAGRDHEIRDLKTALSDAEEKIFPEKAQVKAEIAKLLEEKTRRDEQFKELEAQVRYLEDEIRKVVSEKVEEEERLKGEIEVMMMEKEEKERCIETVTKKVSELESEMSLLGNEMKAKESRIIEVEKKVEKQRREIEEVGEEKREVIRQLCSSLVHYKDECKRLRDQFSGDRPIRPSFITS